MNYFVNPYNSTDLVLLIHKFGDISGRFFYLVLFLVIVDNYSVSHKFMLVVEKRINFFTASPVNFN